MDDNIVQFPSKRCMAGHAVCVACQNTWTAIAPIGTVWLECPSCKTLKGRFINRVERDGAYWICNCGNNLFFINPDGCFCPNCGVQCVFN